MSFSRHIFLLPSFDVFCIFIPGAVAIVVVFGAVLAFSRITVDSFRRPPRRGARSTAHGETFPPQHDRHISRPAGDSNPFWVGGFPELGLGYIIT